MKKLIALLLVLVMSLSLFAGCGTEKPADTTAAPVADDTTAANDTTVAASKDPVTITYWYSNGVGEQEYTDEVEAELNKILSETEGYEHITIDLMPCKDYSTDLTLALSSNAQVDLISTPSYGTTDKIKLGEYMPLDDLIAANPEITADLPEWFMEYGKVNGVTYFVPNYQQMGNGMFWYTRADYAEKAGYTAEQISEIILGQDVEERKAMCEALLLAAREIHGGDDKAYLTAHNFAQARAWYSAANNLVDMSWYYSLSDEDLVVLEDEIKNSQRCVSILSKRYKDQFRAEFVVEPELMDARVPRLILQPLIENAVFHGISAKGGNCDGYLKVAVSQQQESRQHPLVRIDISDNGAGMSLEKVSELMSSLMNEKITMSHIGVQNVARKLKLLYPKSSRFEIVSEPGQGTTVSMIFPYTSENRKGGYL